MLRWSSAVLRQFWRRAVMYLLLRTCVVICTRLRWTFQWHRQICIELKLFPVRKESWIAWKGSTSRCTAWTWGGCYSRFKWTADGGTVNVSWGHSSWCWTLCWMAAWRCITGSPVTDDEDVFETDQTGVLPSLIEQLESNGQATLRRSERERRLPDAPQCNSDI